MRRELDRLHAIGTFSGSAGTFRQLTELTKPQGLYAQLGITQPKKIIQIAPPVTAPHRPVA